MHWSHLVHSVLYLSTVNVHQCTVYIVYKFYVHCYCHCILSASRRSPFSLSPGPGLDERDAAFMKRLRNLAHEALTWPYLGERQRLVWAAALELDAVPFQELWGDLYDGR